MEIVVECLEGKEVIKRHVRVLTKTLSNLVGVVDKLQLVKNFLSTGNPFSMLMDESTTLFEVDDVGMLLLSHMQYGYSACVHITFWDRRLRGRENLCKTMVELAITFAGLRFVWTAIPVRENEKVLAFAKRVGFVQIAENEGVALLHYTRRD